ncbi:OLC1v1016292C1 [Oldenlandia corymbosa var. corymbosa]|uniref:OLC1v1016292C1 n=1 Tax=Oldenlandia corymbosa var. corymbosa TaxID=529605 RepID=A0AAV1E7D4_OLDCO|nr:OLC1v1016292C1 [Oldenlandia corymbosa var. corymbosa]
MTMNCDTSSEMVTSMVKGSNSFTVTGYSFGKDIGPRKYLSYSTFRVGDYEWAVYFYPDGKDSKDRSAFVYVFIGLLNDATDVRVLFELKLLDQSGNGKHLIHSHFNRATPKTPCILKHRESIWGHKRFFRKVDLEKSCYLKNSSLQSIVPLELLKLVPKQQSRKSPLFQQRASSKISTNCSNLKWAAIQASRAQFFGFNGDSNIDKVEVLDMEPAVFKLKAVCLKFAAHNLEAVSQSDGFKHLEESCPSLLSELLKTVASVDEKPKSVLGQKRSSSSAFTQGLVDDGDASEPVNPPKLRRTARMCTRSTCLISGGEEKPGKKNPFL